MTTLTRSTLRLARYARRLPVIVPAARRTFSTSAVYRQEPQENAAVVDEVESLNDAPVFLEDDATQVDWSRSFHGLSSQPFDEETTKILTAPLEIDDVEIKPG
jgi:hypothetical protein